MNREKVMDRDNACLMHTYARSPVVIERGEGMVARDASGKTYLDFTSGIGVNSLGFADPEWVRAVAGQAAMVQHTSNLYYTAPCGRLARRLCQRTGKSPRQVAAIPQYCEDFYAVPQRDAALEAQFGGRFNLVFTGTMTPAQSLDMVLRAVLDARAAGAENLHLLLVGDGYLEEEVRRMAASLGGRVLFAGSVPDPEKYLCAMDVMALPSRYEGFPTVLLEWQCSGLPVLVSSRVTNEAALTPLTQFLPLEAGAPDWAEALLKLPRPERAETSRAAGKVLKAGGYALEDAAAVLSQFYQSIRRA